MTDSAHGSVGDRCARRRHRRPPGGRGPARPTRDGGTRGRSHRTRSPSRRAGRHRHRQDARLPRAGDRVGQAHRSSRRPPRRSRTNSPPRTSRSCLRSSPSRASTSTGRCSRVAATTCASSDCGRPTTPPRTSSNSTTCRPSPSSRSRSSPNGQRTTRTGDQAELDWNPGDASWRAVSVGSDECPGADRCPMGQECFAEQARRRAQASDVVVVNTHLYGLHVGSGGAILPEHDVVVFDEAHVLEDIMSDTVGVADRSGSLRHASAPRFAGSSTIPSSSARSPTWRPSSAMRCRRSRTAARHPAPRADRRRARRGPTPPHTRRRSGPEDRDRRSKTPSNANCAPSA